MFNRIGGVSPDTIYSEGLHFRIPYFQYPIIYDIRSKPRVIKSPTGSKGITIIYHPGGSRAGIKFAKPTLLVPNPNFCKKSKKALGQQSLNQVLVLSAWYKKLKLVWGRLIFFGGRNIFFTPTWVSQISSMLDSLSRSITNKKKAVNPTTPNRFANGQHRAKSFVPTRAILAATDVPDTGPRLRRASPALDLQRSAQKRRGQVQRQSADHAAYRGLLKI